MKMFILYFAKLDAKKHIKLSVCWAFEQLYKKYMITEFNESHLQFYHIHFVLFIRTRNFSLSLDLLSFHRKANINDSLFASKFQDVLKVCNFLFCFSNDVWMIVWNWYFKHIQTEHLLESKIFLDCFAPAIASQHFVTSLFLDIM